MNRYSKLSSQRLRECHVDLQTIFAIVLQGWDNSVLTGARGEADQTAVFSSGKSKLDWPLSKHNKTPSMAADVSPYPIPKDWGEGNRDEYEKFRYFAFYAIGVADAICESGDITHRLRWGGDWNGDKDVGDQKFEDLVHFELIEE